MKLINSLRMETIDGQSQYLLTRKLILNGEVEEINTKDITERMLLLNHLDNKKEVTLIIDSYGGEVYSGLFLYDFIRSFVFDVSTIVVGKAMSAAFFIALAGTKGKRFITPNSTMMQHQTSSMAIGKLSEMECEVDECKRLEELSDKILRKETKCSEEIIKKFKQKDYYFTPEEALKYGIVDKIVDLLP